ncbi:hypothetical protein [Fusibacter sp. 3D3]|uniref:hypothetical protein n=1 Tax=Fusibacter sp. 3D3 TaxID=1048380 RepID=UPI0008538295|nr:hypothetical protein [Fusibacter sp. 3D3]GAU79926.1 hypothetical protein F3D3_4591 [Fusibacter sp. 3D3]
MEIWIDTSTEIDKLFKIENDIIIPKDDYLKGIKNYALATLEHLIGELTKDIKNDELIIYLNRTLISIVSMGNDFYFHTIKEINTIYNNYDDVDNLIDYINDNYCDNYLSDTEKQIINEIASMNIFEYMWKSDYVKCDYKAMRTFALLAYEVLVVGLDKYINGISLIVSTDGSIEKWAFHVSEAMCENIFFDWESSDKIDHYSTIYDVNNYGLLKSSVLELASAHAYEDEYLNTEKSKGSYSIPVKQYCGVLEQELNSLLKIKNSAHKYLMWKDLKNHIRNNNIKLLNYDGDLFKLLKDVHPIRNKAMHGEVITENEYMILRKYVNREIFKAISEEKMDLSNKIIHPTVEELSNIL